MRPMLSHRPADAARRPSELRTVADAVGGSRPEPTRVSIPAGLRLPPTVTLRGSSTPFCIAGRSARRGFGGVLACRDSRLLEWRRGPDLEERFAAVRLRPGGRRRVNHPGAA